MADLAAARVVLIATADHDGTRLPSLPPVERTFHDLRAALLDRCGVREDRLTAVLDPADARTMASAVAREARLADEVLVVYFIGHGLLGPGDQLYLAARDTDELEPGLAEHQALSFASLRQALAVCRAPSVVVVLDCCFSGRVSLTDHPVLPLDPAHGRYLIGSAERVAAAPVDAEHTAFSGAVIDVLTNGDPRGPRDLTLDDLYDAVFRKLREQGKPLPRRQAGDRSGGLVLTRNRFDDHSQLEDPAPGRCPYPGLDAFGVDDAGVFFGREDMTTRLVDALAEPGVVALVGASGSGKSSLLNAGLLASVRSNRIPGSARWTTLRVTPGAHPPAAADLDADLVLVDQFEELFTLCQDPAERNAFLRALTASTNRVVIALRADFYSQATAHPELLAVLRDRQVLVEPMTQEQLRAAIERPAAAAGLVLDDGLADVILRDATEGALPLLSHALWSTWRYRNGSRLTVRGYREAGGIEQAIATTAEAVFTALDRADQDTARKLLPRLVRVGTADLAHPVDRAALPDTPATRHVLDEFTRARLLTLDRGTVRLSHEALLRAWPRLREWVDADRDSLRVRQQVVDDAEAWERAGRDTSLLYRGNRLAGVRKWVAELEPAQAEFVAVSYGQERRGRRRTRTAIALLSVLALLAGAGVVTMVLFRQESTKAADRDLARHVAAEAGNLREGNPGLAKQLSLAAYDIDPDIGLGAVLDSQRTPGVINAGEQALEIAQGNGVLAIATGNSVELRGKAGPALIDGVRTGLIAVDGSDLAVVESAKSVRLWDIGDYRAARDTAVWTTQDPVTAIAAGGGIVYAGTESGSILRWDAKGGTVSTVVTDGPVLSLAVSPERGLLAAASANGVIRLWDKGGAQLTAWREVGYGHPDHQPANPLHRVAFNRAGTLLATAGLADRPDVWRLDDPAKPARVPYQQEQQLCQELWGAEFLAFSPVEDTLIAVCDRVVVVKYDGGVLVPGASSAPDTVLGPVLLDRDNPRRLLTATQSGVHVTDFANPDQPGVVAFLPSPLLAGSAFATGGTAGREMLAVQGSDRDLLWDITAVAAPREIAVVAREGRDYRSSAIALNRDGTVLATTDGPDGRRLVLRDTTAPGVPVLGSIDDIAVGILSIAFHPDRPLLAVSDARYQGPSPTIRIYDIADPGHPRPLFETGQQSRQLAFSRDGSMLVTLGDTSVQGWDITDPARPARRWEVAVSETAGSFAVSPDGELVVVHDTGGSLVLVRLRDHLPAGAPVITTVGSAGTGEIVFDPTGTKVALLSLHGELGRELSRPEIWDVSTGGAPVLRYYLPISQDAGVEAVAFTPDADVLAIARNSTGVELWPTDAPRIRAAICATAGDPITEQDWRHYMGDRPYAPPCR
ncbi:caspase, EACC1-associated type [Actinokineospora terrae]|uniref:WD40 repeat n=1 Tax=Actinokineospora terrae TaxID=155974 RepID=A0A1H9PGD5_9PSEU|nr:caspase family protein [Actinokineospora terrae]SER47214.1 WD40 repeat [Actinokineospora terrae]